MCRNGRGLNRNWYFGVISFIVLFFSSTLSPLCGTPLSCDPHIYSSVGRGIMEGMVPYRDLFDQKGPLIFLIYGLCQSGWHSFAAVYLIEVICLFLSMRYAYLFARFFVNDRKAFLVALVLPGLLCKFSIFSGGGNPSEFLIPFQFMGMYGLAGMYFCPRRFSPFSIGTVLGLGMAAALCLKFNIFCFWVVPVAVTAVYMWRKGNIQNLLWGISAGGGALILPILAYFLYHGALLDMVKGYVLFSSSYGLQVASLESLSANYAKLFKSVILVDTNTVWLVFGIILVLFSRCSKWMKICYACSFAFCLVCLYGSARMYSGHYLITLVPYSWIGVLLIAKSLSVKWMIPSPRIPWLTGCIGVSLSAYAIFNSCDIGMMSGSSEKFESVKKDLHSLIPEGASFVLLQSVDCGMYYALHRVPDVRIFTLCLSTPDVVERLSKEQYQEVVDKKIEYLCVRRGFLEDDCAWANCPDGVSSFLAQGFPHRESDQAYRTLIRQCYSLHGAFMMNNVPYEVFRYRFPLKWRRSYKRGE